LADYVDQNGLVDELYLFDHGITITNNGVPTGSHRQSFGEDRITPEMFAALEPYLSDDASVILGGCCLSQDPDYVQDLADASGATVMGANGNSKLYRTEGDGLDYYVPDGWTAFTPEDEDPFITPGDLGLLDEKPRSSGGSGSGDGSLDGEGPLFDQAARQAVAAPQAAAARRDREVATDREAVSRSNASVGE